MSDIFKWVKCQRKNGTEFLKLIYWSNYANGEVEAGRFNMSKAEVTNDEWTLDEIFRELK